MLGFIINSWLISCTVRSITHNLHFAYHSLCIMAIVLAISPTFTSCRPSPGKPNNVMACKSVIKSVSGKTKVSVLPEPITRRSGNVMACKSVLKSVGGTSNVSVSPEPEPITRRSGNYKPCIWNDNFLQSMKSDYTVTSYFFWWLWYKVGQIY